MASELSDAARAVSRGRTDEALVHLWNAVEPARLTGDASALHAIQRLAEQIRNVGDEGEQRDAERLLEVLRRAVEDERDPEATVALPGANGDVLPEEEAAVEVGEEESESGGRLPQILTLVVILAIVIFNVLAALFGNGE